jgi:hypothetical protein
MTASSFKNNNPKMGQKGMCAGDTLIISAEVANTGAGTRDYDALYLRICSAEKNLADITASDSNILLVSGTEADTYTKKYIASITGFHRPMRKYGIVATAGTQSKVVDSFFLDVNRGAIFDSLALKVVSQNLTEAVLVAELAMHGGPTKALNYLWTDSNNVPITDRDKLPSQLNDTLRITLPTDKTYKVTVSATDDCDCVQSPIVSKIIYFEKAIVADSIKIGVEPSKEVCEGDTVKFIVAVGEGQTFDTLLLVSGNLENCTVLQIITTQDTAGIYIAPNPVEMAGDHQYSLIAIVNDKKVLADSLQITATKRPKLDSVSIDGGNTCKGEEVSLVANLAMRDSSNVQTITYHWSSATDTIITHIYNSAARISDTLKITILDTAYRVQVLVTSVCSSVPDTVDRILLTSPTPVLMSAGSFTPADTSVVCNGYKIDSIWMIFTAPTFSLAGASNTSDTSNTPDTITAKLYHFDSIAHIFTETETTLNNAKSGYYAIITTAIKGNCFATDTACSPYLKVIGLPKSLTAVVTNNTLCAGGTDTIHFYCTDSTDSYQWQRETNSSWIDIAGADSHHYTVTSATMASAGNYRVKIKNQCFDTFSNTVQVRIDTVPIITAGYIQHISLYEFESVALAYSFLNSADGGGVTYSDWKIRLNGDSIFTDTINIIDNGIILSAPIWLDSAAIYATVSNSCGVGASDTFYIYVTERERIFVDTLYMDIPQRDIFDSIFIKDTLYSASDEQNHYIVEIFKDERIFLYNLGEKGVHSTWKWEMTSPDSAHWYDVDTAAIRNDTLIIDEHITEANLNGTVYRLVGYTTAPAYSDTSVEIKITTREYIYVDSIEVKRTILDEPSEDLPTVTFYGDTVYIKMCWNDRITITMHIFGDYGPFTYDWDGNEPLSGSPTDSVFIFTADNNIDEWYCYITDTKGNKHKITALADYRDPSELIVIVNPKMALGKYYKGQQVEISVIPQYYGLYRFYQYEDDKMVRSDFVDVPYFKTAFNGNSNTVRISVDDNNGCRATDVVNIEILPLPNILILNDPKYPNSDVIFPDFRVTVFNSWGLKVKDRNDGYGWDGTDRRGKQVEGGTYFYFVEIKTEDGIETMQGAVTVFKK